MNRYNRILGVQKSSASGEKIMLTNTHWPLVLQAVNQLYGQHSVTSIFCFLFREGAEIGLQQLPARGFKLLPGKFTPKQWEEIKKEILSFLRDDIVKVLDLAWAQSQSQSQQERNKQEEQIPELKSEKHEKQLSLFE